MVHLLSPLSSCLLALYLRLENWPQMEPGFSFSSWPLPESEFRELLPFPRAGKRSGTQISCSSCESRIILPINTEQVFCSSSMCGHYCKQMSLICFKSLLCEAQWRTRAEKNFCMCGFIKICFLQRAFRLSD